MNRTAWSVSGRTVASAAAKRKLAVNVAAKIHMRNRYQRNAQNPFRPASTERPQVSGGRTVNRRSVRYLIAGSRALRKIIASRLIDNRHIPAGGVIASVRRVSAVSADLSHKGIPRRAFSGNSVLAPQMRAVEIAAVADIVCHASFRRHVMLVPAGVVVVIRYPIILRADTPTGEVVGVPLLQQDSIQAAWRGVLWCCRS